MDGRSRLHRGGDRRPRDTGPWARLGTSDPREPYRSRARRSDCRLGRVSETRTRDGPETRRRCRLVIRRIFLGHGSDAAPGYLPVRSRRRAGRYLGKLRHALYRTLSRFAAEERGRLSQEQRPDLRLATKPAAFADSWADRRQRLLPAFGPAFAGALRSGEAF